MRAERHSIRLESQEKAPMDENKIAVIVHTDNEEGANELCRYGRGKMGRKTENRHHGTRHRGSRRPRFRLLRLGQRQDEKGTHGLLNTKEKRNREGTEFATEQRPQRASDFATERKQNGKRINVPSENNKKRSAND